MRICANISIFALIILNKISFGGMIYERTDGKSNGKTLSECGSFFRGKLEGDKDEGNLT